MKLCNTLVLFFVAAVSADISLEDCKAAHIVESCVMTEKPENKGCPSTDMACLCSANQAAMTCFNNCPGTEKTDSRAMTYNANIAAYCPLASTSTSASASSSSTSMDSSSSSSADNSTPTSGTGDNGNGNTDDNSTPTTVGSGSGSGTGSPALSTPTGGAVHQPAAAVAALAGVAGVLAAIM